MLLENLTKYIIYICVSCVLYQHCTGYQYRKAVHNSFWLMDHVRVFMVLSIIIIFTYCTYTYVQYRTRRSTAQVLSLVLQ